MDSLVGTGQGDWTEEGQARVQRRDVPRGSVSMTLSSPDPSILGAHHWVREWTSS